MNPGSTEGHSTLRSYVQIIRRRKWIVILATLLVPLVALALGSLQKPLYQGYAEVLLSRQNLANALSGVPDTAFQQSDFSNRIGQTQADLARVPTVARSTLDSVGLRDRSTSEFLDHSEVESKTTADLLAFRVTDPDRRLAKGLTTAYAREFTRYRLLLDTQSIQQARAAVQRRINQVRAKPGADRLLASLESKAQQLSTLVALQTSNTTLVQSSERAERVRPKPVRNVVIGLAIGLLLGLALAFVREALDTRVRSAEEIGEALGIPLLARIPAPPKAFGATNSLAMLADTGSPSAEAYRVLRTNLDFVNIEANARVLLVTSAVPTEGKTTTAANLAIAMAKVGRVVTLIDLDLRRPRLDRFFGVEGHAGISDVVIGRVSYEDAVFEIDVSGEPGVRAGSTGEHVGPGALAFLAAGLIPPDVGEFVSTRAFARALAEARERSEYVIIDSPPALAFSDALALSSEIDGILVATRLSVIRRPTLRELARVLKTTPTRKLGFFVTDAGGDESFAASYDYGYYSRPEALA